MSPTMVEFDWQMVKSSMMPSVPDIVVKSNEEYSPNGQCNLTHDRIAFRFSSSIAKEEYFR